ncbi:hypothetical protein K7432_005026 [Basidiobolus ranarum]|uniref:AAR2 C-terminal domain-containing protein n=1 Tax=Basidiobolus ranarum TaxID=34480 RepID=A0ABR2WX81_9FUNG
MLTSFVSIRLDIRYFDQFMGAYPLVPNDTYQTWLHLSNYLTRDLIEHHVPNSGKVSCVTGSGEDQLGEEKDEDGLEFTLIDLKKSFPEGASGDQLTKYSLDKSHLLETLLSKAYKSDYENLLGEFQLSFICLILAQNFSGFNQWKKLIHLICSSKETIIKRPKLIFDFLNVLKFQMEECPKDFFIDVISENNFLVPTLRTLIRNINDSDGVDTSIISILHEFQAFVSRKFDWYLTIEEEEEEEGEDAPVIVEL